MARAIASAIAEIKPVLSHEESAGFVVLGKE